MAGGRDDLDLAAAGGNSRAGRQALCAEPVGGVDRAHACAGESGQRPGAAGVVVVPVRQDDGRDALTSSFGDCNDAAEVCLVVWAGVGDHRGCGARLSDQPGVSPVESHEPRIGGQDAARPGGAGAVNGALRRGRHSGYSRSPGTFSQVAPSAMMTSGKSGRTSRGAASTAAVSWYSASSASVIAVGSQSWICLALPASSASAGAIHWTAAASPPTS